MAHQAMFEQKREQYLQEREEESISRYIALFLALASVYLLNAPREG